MPIILLVICTANPDCHVQQHVHKIISVTGAIQYQFTGNYFYPFLGIL